MNPELKAKWVAALRSGEYEQTTGTLRDVDGHGFCCVGVLADVLDTAAWSGSCWHGESGTMDSYKREEIGIAREAMARLECMNDGVPLDDEPIGKHNFTEIADYIEANL